MDSYTSVALFPIMYVVWKLIHKTKIHKPEEVDLRRDVDVIEEYQREYVFVPPT